MPRTWGLEGSSPDTHSGYSLHPPCTPGPLRVLPPRPKACLSLDTGLLVCGEDVPESASVRKGRMGEVIDLPCGCPFPHWPVACGAGSG